MSWLSDITSKAEALLERLDHDAAQALQNPESIIKTSRLINQARRNIKQVVGNDEQDSLIKSADNHLSSDISSPEDTRQHNNLSIISDNEDEDNEEQPPLSDDARILTITRQTPNERLNEDKSHTLQRQIANSNELPYDEDIKSITTKSNAPTNQKRKFKFHTSKLRLLSANQESIANTKTRDTTSSKPVIPAVPEVEDIRASINQSLKNYSRDNDQTAKSSFYDNQPNIILDTSHSTELDDRLAGPSVQSYRRDNSFSINVPERSSNYYSDVASQILRQSALKRRSAFNLDRVINRISNQNGGNVKVNLRPVVLVITDLIQKLNYYFRVYPRLKYLVVLCLIFLQLLVVYVLFFYQAKGQQEGQFESSLKHEVRA